MPGDASALQTCTVDPGAVGRIDRNLANPQSTPTRTGRTRLLYLGDARPACRRARSPQTLRSRRCRRASVLGRSLAPSPTAYGACGAFPGAAHPTLKSAVAVASSSARSDATASISALTKSSHISSRRTFFTVGSGPVILSSAAVSADIMCVKLMQSLGFCWRKSFICKTLANSSL